MSARILLADSHWLIRAGLRATLQQTGQHDVVGEAQTLPDLLQQVQALQPDLIVLDSALQGGGGLAAALQLRTLSRARVLLRTSDNGDTDAARQALRAGCSGVLHSHASERELLDAVRSVLNGGVYLDAEQAQRLAQTEALPESGAPAALSALSPRELSVFRLIAEGCTNRSASEQLQLSAKTVEKYRAAVMVKLRLRSAVDLRLLALDLGVTQRPVARGRAV
jgi:DNA-binding NarL/FixJ family response regulator